MGRRKKTLQTFENRFIVGDCEAVMKTMPEGSIDLVLTSPPYADQRDYGNTNSSILPDEYVDWFLPKAIQIYKLLKEDGSFVLNINDKVVDGFQHLYVLNWWLLCVSRSGSIWFVTIYGTIQQLLLTCTHEAVTEEQKNHMNIVFGYAAKRVSHIQPDFLRSLLSFLFCPEVKRMM